MSAIPGSVMIVAGFELTRTILIAKLMKCLTRLRAGIIKFASLSDDDGSGPNDQNFFDIVASWHESSLLLLLNSGGRAAVIRALEWPIQLLPSDLAGLRENFQ